MDWLLLGVCRMVVIKINWFFFCFVMIGGFSIYGLIFFKKYNIRYDDFFLLGKVNKRFLEKKNVIYVL